jgi:homoserine kinase
MNSGLKVISPASVSNLACGFDILGMALDIPADEIIGRWTDNPGIRIIEMTGHRNEIPLSPEKNIASVAANALLRHVGEEGRGLDLRIHKHIGAGSGLGSSAASATAAVVLVNELLNRPFERRELIPFALEGEKIASGTPVGDNVISSLMGGLILVRDIETLDYHRIFTPPGLFMAILLPDIIINTIKGREILKKEVSLTSAVKQSANLGALIIGMHLGDFDLIQRSLHDDIIEPQRKHLIPHFDELKMKALELGALGCSISGAGPAVFALCKEKLIASGISDSMKNIYLQHGLESRTFTCGINHNGTFVL